MIGSYSASFQLEFKHEEMIAVYQPIKQSTRTHGTLSPVHGPFAFSAVPFMEVCVFHARQERLFDLGGPVLEAGRAAGVHQGPALARRRVRLASGAEAQEDGL